VHVDPGGEEAVTPPQHGQRLRLLDERAEHETASSSPGANGSFMRGWRECPELPELWTGLAIEFDGTAAPVLEGDVGAGFSVGSA
jgi:hypothetical protein